MARGHLGGGVLLAALAAALATLAPAAAPAAEPALSKLAAGKQIFHTGTSPDGGDILAVMAGDTELPASALPCSSCHGEEGQGNPEGGVSPTNLTWPSLTRTYDVQTSAGRKHGPYTPALLKRAIAMGLDSAGNELHVAMPRYRMSVEDMEALVTYIQHLGQESDPGVSETFLRIGTLLPPPGPLAEVGQAIHDVLAAWVAEVNDAGGLYGRKLELVSLTLPEDRIGWPDAVAAFLDRGSPPTAAAAAAPPPAPGSGEDAGAAPETGENPGVFALVGAFVAGSEDHLGELLQKREVPLIGPFTLRPKLDRPVNPWVFYLLPGLSEQGRALVRFALGRHPELIGKTDQASPPKATVLYPDDPFLSEVARDMLDEARKLGCERCDEETYHAGAIDALRMASKLATFDTQVIFFLGEGRDRQILLSGSDHFNWRPEVYVPGSMAGPEALATPAAFQDRFYIAFPTLPGDRSPDGTKAYRKLADDHHLSRAHLSTQLATLAAARVFQEGVKRAGRDLSRKKLLTALENLYQWDSGLTPPLTFSANRRVGAQGAYIVTLDLKGEAFKRVGGWVNVPEEASP